MTAVGAPQALPGSWPMIRTLGGLGVICSLLIVVTFQATLPIIEANRAAALERAIYKVLPGAVERVTFELTADGALQPLTGEPAGRRVVDAGYAADGRLVGVAVEAAGQGFQDVIVLLYGYDPERQTVIGMEVLESRETPGLGDKIMTDPAFVANFAALDVALAADGAGLAHPVVAVKSGKKTSPWQVDGITGATISSVAVADIIRASAQATLPVLARHAGQLRKAPHVD